MKFLDNCLYKINQTIIDHHRILVILSLLGLCMIAYYNFAPIFIERVEVNLPPTTQTNNAQPQN